MSDTSAYFEESRAARIRLVNQAFQYLQETTFAQTPFDWRTDASGRKYSSERLWDECYKPELEYVRTRFMKDSAGRLDRHKIISLTQGVILGVLPLAFVSHDLVEENKIVELNAEFAFLFGILFISEWNVRHYPAMRFDNPANRFDSEIFLHPLLSTDEGHTFIREHKKSLMAKRNGPFPLFLIAQLWFTLEQWGLAYARSQKVWPREKTL